MIGQFLGTSIDVTPVGDTAVDVITRYNPQAVVCAGVPFGHTRPQWILPHGGTVTVDGATRRIHADYS